MSNAKPPASDAPKKKRGGFGANPELARLAGKKGGPVTAEMRRRRMGPYTGTIIDLMDELGLTAEAGWTFWRMVAKAAWGLPTMTDAERELFQKHAGGRSVPEEAVRELWIGVGRRGGKSRFLGVAAAHMAITFDPKTAAPGETAVVPVIAADRLQARVVLRYLRALFAEKMFKPFLHRELKEAVELRTQVNIEVHTASFRSIRGRTYVGLVCDEIAFWRTDDGSANPDSEVLNAARPAGLTIPTFKLIAASSPYASRGELYRTHERFYGQDDPGVLVFNASTLAANVAAPVGIIEAALESDPIAAAAEYGIDGHVQFRRDIEAVFDPAAVAAVTMVDRREVPPVAGVRYFAFCDPSGGSSDSFTLAIAHAEGDAAILDAVRERVPPFSPDAVVQEFAELMRTYGIARVRGDRYAGEWPRERFHVHGISYEPSALTKSDIFRELIAPLNAGRVQLLDIQKLRVQLVGLERRVSRGGKDSIDHGVGGHDDVANAAAGALVGALPALKERHVVRVHIQGGGSAASACNAPRVVPGARWM